jgi:hypothetical protein
MNVVNQFVIGDQHPYQNHEHINMIYEDVLPIKHLPNSVSTIGERLTLYGFIRSVILRGKDGENIPFKDADNNIFDRLKATELNPYHALDTTVMKDNPYLTLPKNMLLYRSCYPIKRGPTAMDTVMCAKESISMNIRLYRMTNGEMEINRNPNVKIYESEIWREIMYYEYVRENIIKKKQCPNHIVMFGYSLCKDSQIDFDKIEAIKNGHIFAPKKELNIINTIPNSGNQILINNLTILSSGVKYVQPIQQTIEKDLHAYNKNILTAFTESPTYNLIQWASRKYANVGLSKQMINIGYHTESIWNSILFQIMAGLYSLQQHNLYINGMSLIDNIYIKDLSETSNTTNYWKYIIDGIEYYVPNYGYLVVIDSKFKDLPESDATVIAKSAKEYKIIGNIFGEPTQILEEEIRWRNLDTLINIINSNNFGKEFIDAGGMEPPQQTLDLINKINKIALDMKRTKKINGINECIYTTMRQFMNNRIGTILSKQEQENYSRIGKNFANGNLVVYEESPGVFKFVLFRNISPSTGMAHILTHNDHTSVDIVSTNVPIGNLYEYSKIQPIKQNYKPNEAKLDENELLETYNLDM